MWRISTSSVTQVRVSAEPVSEFRILARILLDICWLLDLRQNYLALLVLCGWMNRYCFARFYVYMDVH